MPRKTGKDGGDLRESAHKIWLAGLGALAVAEEEGSRLFKTLMERGESLEAKSREGAGRAADAARDVREKAQAAMGWVGEELDGRIAAALARLGVPRREQIDELAKRIEELTAKIDRLRQG